MLAKRKTV